MTAIGFAALWTVLFRSRVTTESLVGIVRRTWSVWGILIAIAVWSILNYRLNYYQPTPASTLPLVAEALATSLFTVALPLGLGFYDPGNPGLHLFGIVFGVLMLAGLLAVTLRRSRRAWRGWLFALAGWFVPVLAVTLPRVGYIGIRAIEQPVYYYLPTLLFIVGVLEAWVAPWTRPRPDDRAPASRRRPAARRRARPWSGAHSPRSRCCWPGSPAPGRRFPARITG